METLKNIKVLIGLVAVLVSIVSGGLWQVWSFEQKLSEHDRAILAVEETARKGDITGRIWAIDVRMWWLQQNYGGATAENLGNRRSYNELEAEKDCLNAAKDIVGKQPAQCRP